MSLTYINDVRHVKVIFGGYSIRTRDAPGTHKGLVWKLPAGTPQRRAEVTRMVSGGDKTADDAAPLFSIIRATVERLLSLARTTERLPVCGCPPIWVHQIA